MWRIAGSNRWPLACHASALPTELIPHISLILKTPRFTDRDNHRMLQMY